MRALQSQTLGLVGSAILLITIFCAHAVAADKDEYEISIAGRIAEINMKNTPSSDDERIPVEMTTNRKRRAAFYIFNKWDKSADGLVYVPYELFQMGSQGQFAVAAAAREFENKTCIRLREKRPEDEHFIRVIDSSLDGCSSSIGRVGGRQTISLASNGCQIEGIAIHEFLHALGLGHTQQRGDRDRFMKIDWSNIQIGFEGNFRIPPLDYLDVLGEHFCYESVMMYGRRDFAIDRSKDVISTPGYDGIIGQRVTWAKCDIDQINRYYHCEDYVKIKGPGE
ncbi:high choriolytic enzyme 1-like [Clytia hemisphaerica]|uniref:Metalloendopeptidase n=1 Tax=Clytia hemisphaerica TaxID=252671 RepID=A0A7M5VGR7_9CNID|eukprot:TCONS_00002523-protein